MVLMASYPCVLDSFIRGISGLSNLLQSATSFQRAFNIGSTTRNSLGPIFASTISPYTISGVNNNGSVAYKEEVRLKL